MSHEDNSSYSGTIYYIYYFARSISRSNKLMMVIYNNKYTTIYCQLENYVCRLPKNLYIQFRITFFLR